MQNLQLIGGEIHFALVPACVAVPRLKSIYRIPGQCFKMLFRHLPGYFLRIVKVLFLRSTWELWRWKLPGQPSSPPQRSIQSGRRIWKSWPVHGLNLITLNSFQNHYDHRKCPASTCTTWHLNHLQSRTFSAATFWPLYCSTIPRTFLQYHNPTSHFV